MAGEDNRVVEGGIGGRRAAATLAQRVVVFALLWVALAGVSGAALAAGGVAVAVATAASLRLSPLRAARPLPLRALLLIPLFLREAIVAGVDVALRALRPSLPMDPAILHHRLGTARGPVPMALAFLVSALPGTLATDWQGRWLHVYTIDRHQHSLRSIAAMERRLAWALTPHRQRPPGGGRR